MAAIAGQGQLLVAPRACGDAPQFLAGLEIPHPQGAVQTAGHGATPVRAQSCAVHRGVVSVEVLELAARFDVPEPGPLVVAHREGEAAITRPRHPLDPVVLVPHVAA